MVFVLITTLIIICITIDIIRRNKIARINSLNKIKEEWGKPNTDKFNQEETDAIKRLYNYSFDDRASIDDITWNDFDMDQIYYYLNRTGSSMGEVNLYRILRNPIYDEKILKERDRLIDFFSLNEELRTNYQLKFKNIGKIQGISFYDYINVCKETKSYSILPHVLIDILLAGAISSIFVNPLLGGILTAFTLVVDVYLYYKTKLGIDVYIPVLTQIGKMLQAINKLSLSKEEELNPYIHILNKTQGLYKIYKKSIYYITLGVTIGVSEMDVLLDYIRVITHIDLIKYTTLMRRVKKDADVLVEAYEVVGFLDSMIAIASCRQQLEISCKPELSNDSNLNMLIKDIYHPLIKNPISNSVEVNQSVLITGSNASGKSTFLKTLGINAILAQTIYTVAAQTYKSRFFKVMSSMALKDDLQNHNSYYLVEIKSLKRILDANNSEIPILCFIDEVLRGTNTVERIAASSKILESISQMNALCFAATHDIELTYITQSYYENYHFKEEINQDTMSFDYKLYKGRSESRNAISLLKLIGYSDDVVNAARDRADNFIRYGSWLVKGNEVVTGSELEKKDR